MASDEIHKYYDATEKRKIRDDLIYALDLVEAPRIAIDCGCGAGADIDYLLKNNFKVYAFDVEEESVSRCQRRFLGNEDVSIAKATFDSYQYPKASLIVADASLFFCPPALFPNVWQKISESLQPHGLFCGSFLGPEDTMAGPTYDRKAYWPDVLVFTEEQLRTLFQDFKVCRFAEHRTSGVSPEGKPHDWHIFSVVAQKLS